MRRLALRCELLSCDGDLVRRTLASQEERDRLDAVRAVGECRIESAATDLVALLDSPDPRLSLAALVALGQTRWPGGVGHIVRRSQAADVQVQRAAAQALADIGTEQALRYLRDWARFHPDPNLRELCSELIRSGSGEEPTGQQ
jgi:HEAT repeat protein